MNEALKITFIYLLHNLTEEVQSDVFEVSQPALFRIINHIEGALLKLEELKAPAL